MTISVKCSRCWSYTANSFWLGLGFWNPRLRKSVHLTPKLIWSSTIDPSLVEAVHGMMYSAARCGEVKELMLIRDQLGQKIGKEAYLSILNDTDRLVNPRIVNKLLGATPNPILVDRYLAEIGQRYGVPGWSPKQAAEEPEDTLISLDDSEEAVSWLWSMAPYT